MVLQKEDTKEDYKSRDQFLWSKSLQIDTWVLNRGDFDRKH
jgi:hypothetical protein